jgi:murein DD-endopeptidase MepM/ murein hydrolase activator NlpD
MAKIIRCRLASAGISALLAGLPGTFMGSASYAQAGTPAFSGEFAQGALVVGRAPPGSRITVDGEPVVTTGAGVFLLGFGRDAAARSELRGTAPDGSTWRIDLAIVPRQFEVQRINGLPRAQVTPPAEVLARIARENALVAEARSQVRASDDFLGGFDWPVKGPITGVYGSQRILNGEPRQPHYGVDVGVPAGTLVRAPAAGRVTLAEPDLYFSGGTLILDHGYGLSSSFLHLSKLLVEVGAQVAAGDPIAEVGATGRVTGPHLDWRMNLGSVRIDPTMVLKALPATAGQTVPGLLP